MALDIKQIAVGDSVNEINQHMIDAMAHLVYDSFTIILDDLTKQGLVDQISPEKTLQPQAAVVGAYMGLLRIMSLDGRIAPQRAFDHLNQELQRLISTSRIGVVGECDVDSMIAEVEAEAAKAKCNVH